MNDASSILNTPVTWFRNYNDPVPAGETTLLYWLQSNKRKAEVEDLRNTQDKKRRNTLKASLPAITPSGTFSQRNAASLIKHSGFICLDIDLKGNERIRNYSELKKEMAKIKQVAYCGLSVSAEGYFVLIPIAYSHKHLQHFFALQKVFASFGIKIDEACKDVCRLRGLSVDDNAYFNHKAIPFTGLLVPSAPVFPKRSPSFQPQDTQDSFLVESLLQKIHQTKSDITGDYNQWFSIGCNFAATFGENGRSFFHQVCQFHPEYSPAECDRKFDNCIKKAAGATPGLGTFINRCKEAGLIVSNRTSEPSTARVSTCSSKAVFSDMPSQAKQAKSETTIPVLPRKSPSPWRPAFIPDPLYTTDIDALESFFSKAEIPAGPLQLSNSFTISNPQLFISAHLSVIKANNGRERFYPFIMRLLELKSALSKKMALNSTLKPCSQSC